jgi:hypothetical protein
MMDNEGQPIKVKVQVKEVPSIPKVEVLEPKSGKEKKKVK